MQCSVSMVALATQTGFTTIDWLVLVVYFLGVSCLGLVFWNKNATSEQFTSGGRSLPGWLCGLSIFATFLSSISYLALPGKSYVANWNAFVFSLALPLAGLVAVRYFVPLYRRSSDVSAYALLERRFGLWARLTASAFYLLYQIARSGVVMYLMALPMAVIFGWDIRTVILATGIIVTAYAFVGGIAAVIWADAVQAIVLMAGAVIALGILLGGMPGGMSGVTDVASQSDKLSLGSFSLTDWSSKTFWVVLIFGLFENLKNFGIDQSYVQRYIASRSDAEAAKSVWLAVILYVPVSALFLYIGTALFAFYQTHPDELDGVRSVVASQQLTQSGLEPTAPEYATRLAEVKADLKEKDLGDRVFPHFIANQLPTGLRGLLIAAVFAAAMSTVSTSLNSAATLVMSDFYERLTNAEQQDAGKLVVLRGATIAWGVMGTAMALVLVRVTESALDIWWTLSGILGAVIVGLFLTGLLAPRLKGASVVATTAIGVAVVAWMSLSQTSVWPATLKPFASQLEPLMTIVVGSVAMIVIGSLLAVASPRKSTGTDAADS